eukprot:SAG31_NODE_2392_length_5797_cov_6.901369_5_plen_881_part_00
MARERPVRIVDPAVRTSPGSDRSDPAVPDALISPRPAGRMQPAGCIMHARRMLAKAAPRLSVVVFLVATTATASPSVSPPADNWNGQAAVALTETNDASSPLSPCLPLQAEYRENRNVPGSGLVEGDFDQISFASGNATLSFRVTKQGLPPLRLAVMAGPESAATGIPVITTPVIGEQMTTVEFPIHSWDDGEWPATISADLESRARGWCSGAVLRMLRKAQLPQQLPTMSALSLRLNQPVLFITDDFVESRDGTHRRLIPVTQQRVGNSTFCSHKLHHYMRYDRPLSVSSSSLSFGMKVDYGVNIPPTVNPSSEAYDCGAALPSGDALPVWSCTAREELTDTAAQSVDASPTTATSSGNLSFREVWPIKTTFVRFYRQEDGDVALNETQVLYTSVRHHVCSMTDWSTNMSCTFGNVSLLANAGYPMWQRMAANGIRETLILPVDGVRGRPLLRTETLDASTVPHIPYSRRKIWCRHVEQCACDGENVVDPACANDNFGSLYNITTSVAGSWLLPSVQGRPLTLVYSQARRVSAFAPRAVPWDNLPSIRRVLVSWSTTDGLHWQQNWWGGDRPADPLVDGDVGEQYGAVNFCAETRTSARTACRTSAAEDRAPLLSWVMPYDAAAQTFHLDLAAASDGLTFNRVMQEGPEPPSKAVPTGKLGHDWNGGMIDAILPPAGVRRGQYTHALLSGVSSGAHFMFGLFTQPALNATETEDWAARQFFGPTISQWPGFGALNGWAGIAKLGAEMTIEVGYARWRTEGWVSLKAATANATVVTKPLRVFRADIISCPIVSATANYRGGPATVELLNANGEAIDGYPVASLSPGDDVAWPLAFGIRNTISRELVDSDSAGIKFRVCMIDVGSELFGVSFRCANSSLLV